jgi:3-deoxy-manno-octulosonate cytidylyltransferase (CMP-KDO synthetase)
MNVVGVIPARWASTRLPGKSLVDLCGKPMVQWVVERAMEVKSLSQVIVATDDERIKDAVESFGGTAVMTREDHPSGTDRIAEAACGFDADLVVNIQGDEPLLNPQMVDDLIGIMINDDSWDMGTAAAPILNDEDLNDPSVVKVVWAEDHRALYFSRSIIPFVRDDDMRASVKHWRHLGIYVYRYDFLKKMVEASPCVLEQAEKLEQLRSLHLGAKMVVMESDDTGIGVDTPEDVIRAESLLRADNG